MDNIFVEKIVFKKKKVIDGKVAYVYDITLKNNGRYSADFITFEVGEINKTIPPFCIQSKEEYTFCIFFEKEIAEQLKEERICEKIRYLRKKWFFKPQIIKQDLCIKEF